MTSKSNLPNKVGFIKRTSRSLRVMLLGLLMVCVSLVTGCASESQVVRPMNPQVQVDSSLMVQPNFQTRMVSFLSGNPVEQTNGLDVSKKP